MILKTLICILPWQIKRFILQKVYGYELHPSCRIGYSFVYPKKLIMGPGSQIGHLNVIINLDMVNMSDHSKIGRSNWITGFSTESNSKHFAHQLDRRPELHIGHSSAITKNHHLDCTNTITIGKFSTIAGYKSQFLTHSINVIKNIQDSLPISIGDYTFISTNVVILGGAKLPDRSILGAKSLLNKEFIVTDTLYGGVPAKAIKEISKDAKYFKRETGFVI
ncbi:acyltransferase [Zobellia uliginosa]|uniref:acyltransferase n=1 Tax=Zobellia uliginosa TaxID=143224 RepID=UPI001C070D44|nr:acyltransferase [Zobellia uliginosa]MBU2948828.1 acyltransferase [Zobellia uliginosa]